MAYIVAQDTTVEISQTTVDVVIPSGHVANDLILMFIGQDGGATDITTAASGWNLVSGAQAAAQAQRSVVYWRLATSSSEPNVTFSGAVGPWIVFTMIVRGADQTTPINASNKTDSANSTSSTLTSGTVTTTVANCLVFSFIHMDGLFKITPQNPSQVTPIFKQLGNNTCGLLNFFNQLTASATTAVPYLLETASEGGSCWTVAIADATPSTAQLSPTVSRCYDLIKRYGGISTYGASDPAFTRHDGITWQQLTNIAATTIDGVTVLNNTFTEVNQQSIGQPWGSMTGISVIQSAVDATGRWVGATHTITSTDFTNKTIYLEWQMNAVSTAFFGSKGVIIYLQDGSGNWVAHLLSIRQGIIANTNYVSHIDTAYTPYASGGTIDLTDITRVAFMYHRVTTSVTQAILRVQNFLLYDFVQMEGGCAGDPITAGKIQNFFSGHGPLSAASVQGKGQALIKSGVKYGNGSQATYLDYSANSLETPLSFNNVITRRFWKVTEESPACELEIVAGADDVLNFTSCVLATDTRQIFCVDPTSSASADYNFSGSSVINWLVQNDVFNFNQATFVNCAFELNGGGVDSCQIIDCEPMLTNDPSNIIDSDFTSPGTGHAIEITDTGTFDFEGNQFFGYGADTTTDASIYNNSGGLVTLNLGPGDTIPTYRNGTGASTVINVAPIVVTATVLANSRVQLYNVTDDIEIDNAFVAGTSYSYSMSISEAAPGDVIRLRVCKKSYSPFEASAVANVNGNSIVVSQELDPVYAAYLIDGEAITIFDADYIDDEVDLSVSTNFSATEFYAWYNFNLTTEDGIRYFYGGIFAAAETDILIKTAIVDLKFDNLTTDNVFQEDSIRIHRDDEAYPVKNPTTGGGGIDIVWRNQAYLPSITALAPFAVLVAAGVWDRPTSSHTTAGTFGKELGTNQAEHDATQAAIAALPAPPSASTVADAVWDEAISGHLTAGSTGEKLNSASAPSAATVASAVRSELTTELGRIDVATSTRLATAGYTAPSNSDIAAIKSKTDNLPSDPADESSIQAAIASIPAAPSAASVASQVRTELTTELGRIDASVSSRLATAGYVAPANSDIASIKAKTDNLPADPADNSDILSAISGISGGSTPEAIADAVRTELSVELARVDVAISTRNAVAPDNSGISAIKAKTDNLPASPASEGSVTSVGTAVLDLPTLSEIEASTVLAKEATVLQRATPAQVDASLASYDGPTKAELDAAQASIEGDIAAVKQNTDLIPATV